MQILKTPAEYAKSLSDAYFTLKGLRGAVFEVARSHPQLPLDYLIELQHEVDKLVSERTA